MSRQNTAVLIEVGVASVAVAALAILFFGAYFR